MSKSHLLGAGCACALACVASSAYAATTFYDSQASYLGALGVQHSVYQMFVGEY